jgi:hypothetical protein
MRLDLHMTADFADASGRAARVMATSKTTKTP